MQYPGHVVKIGESGAAVAVLHQQLLARTCGPVDAGHVFGVQTEGAVKLFQARSVDRTGRPLKQDGEVGPLTWAALFGDRTIPARTSTSSPLLRAVLAHAVSQLSVREHPKNSNSGPEVDEYLKRAGVPLSLPPEKKPWCCAFVYWCFDEAARKEHRGNPMVRTAGCLDHWNRAENHHGRRIEAARAVEDPGLIAPGMILIIDHNHGLGHTGLVEEVVGGMLHTIEGNTDASLTREGGGVYRLTRKIGDVNKGFIDYSGA